MNPGRRDGKRQSPRKRDAANNEDKADADQSPARRTMEGGIFVGIPDFKPAAVYFNMVGQFGGPCFDRSANVWKKSLPVEVDGSIDVSGTWEYAQVRHLAQTPEQAETAANYVGQVAKQVTGRIFITVLREAPNRNGELNLEEVDGITMSGFWLDKTKFVTCAHFLQTVFDTNADETEKFLKTANPPRPRAFVSNKKAANQGLMPDSPESWPVYLLRVSRTSDIAIFELTKAAAKGGKHPPHSMKPSDLSALLTATTSENASGFSSKETDVSYLRLFAAYYPGSDPTVEASDFSPERKQFAKDANIAGAWRLLCDEGRKLNPGATKKPADFADTFAPHTRSVAFGQVETTHRAIPCHAKSGNSLFAQTRECSIVGTYGCSGGMVCHVYREAGSWRSVVVGLFHGESWNDRRYNEIVAFTPAFVDAVRTGSFWDTA
ncbi:uncharacterized protein PV07_06245 [Cladophialophora immunda]|uniref:Uncharacterized protein n=1 Tax=Cladophialophora immunda TaxID=569365 RepID=A0A0D2CHF8_9EURO|nr:uncharacterized protein PV07_06245 [Cladophialophora immunda]KIW30503.1 hypothetical protein PV07_06245 [Cladophialophora immunda]